MKALVLLGSARKQHTHRAVKLFLDTLETLGPIQTEVLHLSDYRILPCIGCQLCLDKGEEQCPLHDDRDLILEKMDGAQALLLATPNYAFQVSGILKVFLDRVAFLFHRPRFFGKTLSGLVTQGIHGGTQIREYLEFLSRALGGNPVKGLCLNTRDPLPETLQARNRKAVEAFARRFYRQMEKAPLPPPSLMELLIFRFSRTRIRKNLDAQYRDWQYYRDQGWFSADYYYDSPLNPLEKLAGRLFDRLA